VIESVDHNLPMNNLTPLLRFDVALSYSSSNAWLARDIFKLLTVPGFNVYCYDEMPDAAHGVLRSGLRDIYYDSHLNIVLWSRAYRDSQSDSFVALERRAIADRHVERGESKSLFIVLLDDTPLERDFQTVLAHKLQDFGVLGLQGALISRLKSLYSHVTEEGAVVCHPSIALREGSRGLLQPCSFTISRDYASDKLNRWKNCADILVDFPNPLKTRWVYLIPSGLTTPFLTHPSRLFVDPSLLEHKRRASIEFIEQFGDQKIKGAWFPLSKNGVDHATVYSISYDRFLNKSAEDL